jgi:hypothetical protein
MHVIGLPRRLNTSWAVMSLTFIAVVGFGGCKNRLVATVDGVLLAECSGTVATVPGVPRLKLTVADTAPISTVGAPALVIERAVPWRRVKETMDAFAKSGNQPSLLCGRVSDVETFKLEDTLVEGPTIQMVVEPKGKFCVQTPEVPQAFCVQGSLGHIPRADVRQTIRETMTKWKRNDVEVTIDPEVEWADVVRAIDGARTCCGKTTMRVALKRPSPAPSPQ